MGGAGDDAAPGAGRPKLALVLSGGGARGAAHIGVLKVLDELHVPVDLVTGTSMGSIIGGLFATGWTPQQMEDLLVSIDWSKVFVDRLDRKDRSYQRKQDDIKYLIPVKMRFKGWKPYLPAGVLGGQRLELLLRSLEIESTGEWDFNRFPIPYRAVAADIETGEAVILDHGSLAVAMRASMSVPGAFPPVEIEGHRLVDGGAVANLPIRIAQGLGAEHVIAIDITSPLSEKEEITSFVNVLNQQSAFLTVGNRLEDLKHIRPGDVVIKPELGDMSFSDFDRSAEAVGIGEAAARALSDQLRPYAVGDAEWAAYVARRHRRPESDLRVDTISLVNSSWVDDRILEPFITQKIGEPLDLKAVDKDISQLMGLDYFGIIKDEFRRDDAGGTLTITAPRKPYGRGSLQFALALRGDLQGTSDYAFAVRHLVLAVNRLGGEWINSFQFGNPAYVSSEFYQPLDYGMRWFALPWVGGRRVTQKLWVDGEAVAEYKFQEALGRIDFGRVFGNWGSLRIGPFLGQVEGDPTVGLPIFPSYNERDGGVRVLFGIDTLDSTVFARHGASLEAMFRDSSKSFGSDRSFRQYALGAGYAWTFGRETFYPGIEFGDNLQRGVPLRFLFMLGGFRRLSGLAQNELLGERMGLARIVYYHELTKFDLGVLTSRLYVGATAEAGNVYQIGQPVSLDTIRHGGSVFVGAETPIGPIILGYGAADAGRRRFYFIIGESF